MKWQCWMKINDIYIYIQYIFRFRYSLMFLHYTLSFFPSYNVFRFFISILYPSCLIQVVGLLSGLV